MQAEEFYKHIQQKIEESSFEPDWNKSDVWQRIEQQKEAKNPFFVAWKAVAAAVVLLSAVGIMLYKNEALNGNNNTVAVQSIVPEKTTTETLPINSIAQKSNFPKQRSETKIAKKGTLSKSLEAVKTLPQEEVIVKNSNINLQEKETIITENKSENLLVTDEKLTENEPIIVTENKPNLAETNFNYIERRKPAPRERIAVLEIPDDAEMANIPQEPRRKNFASRLRKTNKNRSEQDENLPSMANKPNKVWAFVKESLRNETMTKDSTEQ